MEGDSGIRAGGGVGYSLVSCLSSLKHKPRISFETRRGRGGWDGRNRKTVDPRLPLMSRDRERMVVSREENEDGRAGGNDDGGLL